MKQFYYESNACWGNVETDEQLDFMIENQIEENNGISTLDDFLDKSMQHKDGFLNFGTRSEHKGKKSLREFLKEQGELGRLTERRSKMRD